MLIHEMHYDVKLKLNSIDANKFESFSVPEIDWFLNEAERVWIKRIAFPRLQKAQSFEFNTRSTHDIREIVINPQKYSSENLEVYNDSSYIYTIDNLDPKFWYFLSGHAEATKGTCTVSDLRLFDEQHDDLHEESLFSQSSFEWREINIRIIDKGILLFTDGTFKVSKLKINYLKKPRYMHNAQDFQNGQYNRLSDDTLLTGRVHSEFSDDRSKCSEIVDIAVLLMTNAVTPQYDIKGDKLNLTT